VECKLNDKDMEALRDLLSQLPPGKILESNITLKIGRKSRMPSGTEDQKLFILRNRPALRQPLRVR
jgi:hypothetical protein